MKNEEWLDEEIERLAEQFDREKPPVSAETQDQEEEEILEFPEDSLEETEEWGFVDTRVEILYLDENHNFVPEEEAVQCVIRETDADGNLIRETWCYRQEEAAEEADDGITYEMVYLDEEGKEVEAADATQIIFRKYKEGVLIDEDRLDLVENDSNDFYL